ncbi:MAG: EamA family transporter [Chitinophagales bacterium]|nr:EamA family transporter [Chitinophagales bacterium]
MNNSTKAHVYVIIANIIYGLNYVIAKIALTEIPPLGMVFTRVFVSLIIFWLIHFLFIKEKIVKADHKKMILCGIFGVACNQMLFFTGLDLTSEIHASLIMITTPLLVLIISWIIVREAVTIFKIAGIVVGAIGVYLLISVDVSDINHQANVWGDIFIMLNASSYAIFLVIAKPLMKKYAPFTIMFWIFLYGFIIVFPFGIKDFLLVDWMHLSRNVYMSWLYVVIGATFFAYVFNILGLNHGSPALVSIYIYTQPVIATFVAVVLQTDSLSFIKIISSLLIFTGVAIVSFTAQKTSVTEVIES